MKVFSICILLFCFSVNLNGQVAISSTNSTPDSSAILDLQSQTKGLLIPRLTVTERDQINKPSDGLLIFNLTAGSLQYYLNGYWYSFVSEVDVEIVTNPTTGRTWMAKNLGASNIASSSTDSSAYGDLYQWGRLKDGHQNRNSITTTTVSINDQPGHNQYITPLSIDGNWLSSVNNNLWQGSGGINNPCPTGFRIPTDNEWDAERLSWTSNNAGGAFSSDLILTMGGRRNYGSGVLISVDGAGFYWSSTPNGYNARILTFGATWAGFDQYARADAGSIRCIKD